MKTPQVHSTSSRARTISETAHVNRKAARTTQGPSRRDFLKVGLGGFALSVLPGELFASSTEKLNLGANYRVVPIPGVRQRPIVMVWLEGGMSHIDTFSPIPTAPDNVRGPYSQIQTTLPGAVLSEKLPLTARHMNKIALMRNIQTSDHSHSTGTSLVLTGSSETRSGTGNSKYDSFAVRLGKHLGSSHVGYITFNADAGNPSLYPGVGQNDSLYVRQQQNSVNNEGSTPYPSPFGKDFDRDRHRGRLALLEQMNRQALANSATNRWGELTDRANSMLDGDINGAFDLTRVPDRVREKYGKTSFGNAALIAKRLIDAGAPIITINKFGWDHHSNIESRLDDRLPELDRIIASLFDDLGDRAIIAVGTEFGRTPKINGSKGRDHWPQSNFLLIGGAGVAPHVFGRLDNTGNITGDDGIFDGRLAGSTIARAAGYEFVEERAGVLTSNKMPVLPIFSPPAHLGATRSPRHLEVPSSEGKRNYSVPV